MNDFQEIPNNSINTYRHLPQYTSCLLLSENNHFLLQQRGNDWPRFPGVISVFGGKIEKGEQPEEALRRELKEELDIDISIDDVIKLSQYTEKASQHEELIYAFGYRLTSHQLYHCHEGSVVVLDSVETLMSHPKVMDEVKWLVDKFYPFHQD